MPEQGICLVEEGRTSFKSSRMYQENEVSRGPVISCILRESSKVEDEMMYVNSPLQRGSKLGGLP